MNAENQKQRKFVVDGKMVVPRVTIETLAETMETKLQKRIFDDISINLNKKVASKIPTVPPRSTKSIPELPNQAEDQAWFIVLSPRETRGISGPFSVIQMKNMCKSGEVSDRTLVWKEGENDWKQLIHQPYLRSQLINFPIVPPKIVGFKKEQEIFDPLTAITLPNIPNISKKIMPIPRSDISRYCVVCGSFAVVHLPGEGEVQIDLFKGRKEVGTTESASEILPGFLWVGTGIASQHRSILALGFTLLINCTHDLNSPESQPPYFRCRDAVMESPNVIESGLNPDKKLSILSEWEKIYDWIELERVFTAKNLQSDLPPEPYHGPTDKFGRPLKVDKPFRRPDPEDGHFFPPRVLIWSRNGTNRSCAITAAYLIKYYGITIEKALKIILVNRPEMKISPGYLELLKDWSARYTLGLLLCIDCKQMAIEEELKTAQIASTKVKDAPYNELIQVLKDKLPNQLVEKLDKQKVLDPHLMLVKIPTSFSRHSMWSGLVDLNLSDRRLADQTIALVFTLLVEVNKKALRQIRHLSLRNNLISSIAMRAWLQGCYPRKRTNPDNVNYLFDQCVFDLAEPIELLSLDLAHNILDINGAIYLSLFIKQCSSIYTLDIYHNNIEDEGMAQILETCITPMFFFQSTNVIKNRDSLFQQSNTSEDRDEDDDRVNLYYNQSITSLNIGRNQIHEEAFNTLIRLFKQNVILTRVSLDDCQIPNPQILKNLTQALRIYNNTIQQLSLEGTKLSVKSGEYLSKMLSYPSFSRIHVLNLSRCSLNHLHLKSLCHDSSGYLFKIKRLNLSGNSIGDSGAQIIAEEWFNQYNLILSQYGRELASDVDIHRVNVSLYNPNLQSSIQYIDLSSCSIESKGCNLLIQSFTQTIGQSLVSLDLSYNTIGSQNRMFFEEILKCKTLISLQLNYCKLQTKIVKYFLQLLLVDDPMVGSLANSSQENSNNVPKSSPAPLISSLRVLGLAGNEISDSIAETINQIIQLNYTLNYIDLGFNQLTNHIKPIFDQGIKITSQSKKELKVSTLHINLIGNPCDPYILDMPNMSRCKLHFSHGLEPNPLDPYTFLGGFSHLDNRARNKFFVQKALHEQYSQMIPNLPIDEPLFVLH